MGHPTYNLMRISDGREGIRQTLKLMSTISRKYSTAPQIRELACKIVAKVPEKQWGQEAAAILAFCQKAIRYTKDIEGVETLQTPAQTLRIGQGDCDDKSMLAASLLMSVGHPARFRAVGMIKGTLSHVFVETKMGGKWVALETTENWPLGRVAKGIRDNMIEHIPRA